MADVENVVVVRFAESSKAYQALSVLKDCDAQGRIALASAAVVERTKDGELRIPEGTDNVGLLGTASGSLIGMLVGVLGGPVGALVGWGAGALIGGAFDVNRVVRSDEALTAFGRAIPPGSTAVIAAVAEPAVEVIDGEMSKLEGEVTRRPTAQVLDELEATEAAAETAAREARMMASHPAKISSRGKTMKLVRFGPAGREKPGIIDSDGKIRDLSRVVPDINGEALSPASLAKIKKANIDKLPLVKSSLRLLVNELSARDREIANPFSKDAQITAIRIPAMSVSRCCTACSISSLSSTRTTTAQIGSMTRWSRPTAASSRSKSRSPSCWSRRCSRSSSS